MLAQNYFFINKPKPDLAKYSTSEVNSLVSIENKSNEQVTIEFYNSLINQDQFALLTNYNQQALIYCLENRYPAVSLYNRLNVQASIAIIKSLSIKYAILTRDCFLFAILISSTYKNIIQNEKNELEKFISDQICYEYEEYLLLAMKAILKSDLTKLKNITDEMCAMPNSHEPYDITVLPKSIIYFFLENNFVSKAKFTRIPNDSLMIKLCKCKLENKCLSDYLSFNITVDELNEFIKQFKFTKPKHDFYTRVVSFNLINTQTLIMVIETLLDPLITDSRLIELTKASKETLYHYLFYSSKKIEWQETTNFTFNKKLFRRLKGENNTAKQYNSEK